MIRRNKRRVQYAALPFRRRPGHALEALLITSREARRWIVPKGWPAESLPPHESAAREAIEEAGVAGLINKSSIGTYSYEKRLGDGSVVICQVKVLFLRSKSKCPIGKSKNNAAGVGVELMKRRAQSKDERHELQLLPRWKADIHAFHGRG